jgi:glycosyltransferase involved in cell wall biosynthesis
VVSSSETASRPPRSDRDPGRGSGLAIVTESVEWGGTERVMQTLADSFPAAVIVANDFTDLMGPGPDATPWAMRARLVRSGRQKRHFLGPLYARRLAGAPVGPARVVLALPAGGWALAAPVPPGGRLVCYCTGPPPALYGEGRMYLQSERALVRPLMLAAAPAIRAYYRRLMRRPHRLVTVSRSSAAALERVYGRQADVVHPPVRTGFFTPAGDSRRDFLAVARLVPQKNLEQLVAAFRHLRQRLVIAGRGPWLDRLRANAPANVSFAGWVDDGQLRELYRRSRALLCPSAEEFGIVMAEAHACGTPVIAPASGGACEIVDDPATGILLDRVDADSLSAAVRAASDRDFDPDACRASAERFAERRFVERMEQVIDEELAAGQAPVR